MQRKTYVGILNTSPRKGERERVREREKGLLNESLL